MFPGIGEITLAQARVMLMLREHGPMTTWEIAAAMPRTNHSEKSGFNANHLRHAALWPLRDRGLIFRYQNGRPTGGKYPAVWILNQC